MKKRLFLILFLISQLIVSQEAKQPKVGLVLSGGGAKGFAHLGVLKELEKAGVQVDYIGGTSMGAIIGGLYASGYTANQVEEIISQTDFNTLLQDKIERRNKPFFEKAYREKNAISLPIKKGKIELPLGLSKGQSVLNFFTELLSCVDNIKDFSKLPTPFFCVATDIETGKEVVLEKGNLPLALRASGSFPSLLNPVEIDKKWLVDGGVVNNFPVDRMREKGVDIIIGVNVQGNLNKREEMPSITSVLQQIINFQMYKKSDSQVKEVDVYIRPKIFDYNVISFDKGDKIISEGTAAVKPFRRVFDSISSLQKIKKERPKVVRKEKKVLIDRIIITGNKKYTKNYILGKLKLRKGDLVSYQDISKKINILTATKNFERADYTLEKSFKGKKITIKVIEEKSKSSLGIGLHYDKIYGSGVLLNYNHRKLLLQNDELSFDVIVGDNVRYNLHYFVDNGVLLSYGISSKYESFSTNVAFNRDQVNKINFDYKGFTNRVYAQTTLDKKFALGFGIEHRNIIASTETLVTKNKQKTYFDDSNYANSFAFLSMDTFNKEMFPTEGFYADVNFSWYFLSDRNIRFPEEPTTIIGGGNFSEFSQVNGTFSFATTFLDRITFQITSEAGFTFGKEETGVFNYRLGGYNKNYIRNFHSFYGYEVADLSNYSFLKSGLDLRCRFFDRHYFSLMANYARLENNFFKKFDLLKDLKSGYAVGYGVETFLGPIELKYSWSPDHKEKYWLFNLGFWF